MSTVTSTAVAKWEPKSVHEGLNVAAASYITSASLTAASVVQMLKVPDGARIYDVKLEAPSSGAVLSVGDGGDPDRFIVSATADGTIKSMTVNLGYKYSVSDAQIEKWDTIDVLTGSAAFTGTIKVAVTYYLDKDDNFPV